MCFCFTVVVQKKTRTHVNEEDASGEKIPRTFIMRRGKVDGSVVDLVHDLRRTMLPYTARKLQVKKCVSPLSAGHGIIVDDFVTVFSHRTRICWCL